MKKNKINFGMLVLFLILGSSVMNRANAMENKRFEEDVQDQQRLGRGNPTPIDRAHPSNQLDPDDIELKQQRRVAAWNLYNGTGPGKERYLQQFNDLTKELRGLGVPLRDLNNK